INPPDSTYSALSYITGSPFFIANSAICGRRAAAYGPATRKRTAPARPLFAAWNAISISVALLMSRCCTVSPNAPAAISISFTSCEKSSLPELAMKATRESLGMVSFNISSRFPLSSGRRVDKPVIFPLGRARLATKPLATASPAPASMTIGIAGRFPGCAYIAGTTRYDDVYLQAYQFGSEHRKAIHFSLIRSPLNDNVFPLYIPQLAETLAERLVSSGLRGKGGTSQEAYPGDFRRLLRLN